MSDSKTLSFAIFAALAGSAVATELPSGVLAVPLTRDAGLSAYFAQVQIGTPPQKEYLKIDTGSPRYSFLDPRNAACSLEFRPCERWGTFDNTTSSTCHYAGPGFQDNLGVFGSGDFLNDTIILGGVATKNMYFGYTSRYAFLDKIRGDANTIMGLSLDCTEANPTCIGEGPFLLPQLKNASTIDHMATSFYLGPDDSNVTNAQMLVGNAYDEAKVDGDMFTVDMVDPSNMNLTDGQTNVVNVTAMEVVLDGGNRTLQTYGEQGVGVPVLLDTGIASWYMTETIFDPVFRGLGGSGEASFANPYQVVDCIYRDPNHSSSYISVEFGPAGKIKVPLHSIVSKFADGTCAAFIIPRQDTLSSMGDPFLRGVYSIFDQENFSISLGQVKHTTEERIVRIPPGGFKASS